MASPWRRENGSRQPRGGVAKPLWLLILLAGAAVFVQWFNRPATGPAVSGTAQVIDGDSLRVSGRELRLKGLDAPEGRQTCQRDGREWPCGQASADWLRAMTFRRTTVCDVVETDRFGRGLAYCTVDGEDINAKLVSDGMAVSFGGYTREETEARLARLGLWSGTFEKPQEWRRRNGVGR
jgi:endonuclease YncB( thermonuclease family)